MEGTIGEIRAFAGNFAPRTWSFCQGQLIAISSNTALFSIIGTMYGGDGRSTFGLPDLRGRSMIGQGHGPGLPSYRIGQEGGKEEIALTELNLPAHNHVASTTASGTGAITGDVKVPVSTDSADEDTPAGTFLASDIEIYSGASTANTFLGDIEEDLSVNIDNLNVDISVGNTGGATPYNNMMPSLALNYIICMLGVYPSRS